MSTSAIKAQLLLRVRRREPVLGIRLFRHRWQYGGAMYARRAYGVAPEAAVLLLLDRAFREIAGCGFRVPQTMIHDLTDGLRKKLARRLRHRHRPRRGVPTLASKSVPGREFTARLQGV